MKSSVHIGLNFKQICVYLLLLGCVFSLPSLNRAISVTEITASVPVEPSSGIPDGEEGTHSAKDLHSSIFSTKSRQNPGRPLRISRDTNTIESTADADAKPVASPTVLPRPSYYAFLFRYNLF